MIRTSPIVAVETFAVRLYGSNFASRWQYNFRVPLGDVPAIASQSGLSVAVVPVLDRAFDQTLFQVARDLVLLAFVLTGAGPEIGQTPVARPRRRDPRKLQCFGPGVVNELSHGIPRCSLGFIGVQGLKLRPPAPPEQRSLPRPPQRPDERRIPGPLEPPGHPPAGASQPQQDRLPAASRATHPAHTGQNPPSLNFAAPSVASSRGRAPVTAAPLFRVRVGRLPQKIGRLSQFKLSLRE